MLFMGYIMKKLLALILVVLSVFLCSCGNNCNCDVATNDTATNDTATDVATNDIVIFYTNDIHCAFETEIGFSGLASLKKQALKQTPYVSLVDAGDAVQGEVIGSVSKGEYIVDIMNYVGYDIAVFGNHEFDYGMDRLQYLVNKSNAQYLNCNITYNGNGENRLSSAKPYKIISYGETDVAFIGATTPETLTSSTPTYFMENGSFVYDFAAGNNGTNFYQCIQKNIDECKSLGADYIILVAHLGDLEVSTPYSSIDVINNTVGIDVVIDGHAHNSIPTRIEKNKQGSNVLLTSTGTKFANVGQLVITANGYITAGLISDYNQKDAETDSYIATVKAKYESEINKVVAKSDIALSCTDNNGIRLVRNRETAIGNLCADAYRYITGADVALVNGGGIRADLPAGDITYADIIAVHPFGNMMCMVNATGQEIIDSLEIASRSVRNVYEENGYAVGEEGSFQSVSGLKYTVDTTVESAVEFDENGMFKCFNGNNRRVKNVLILNDNCEYVPIDPNGVYTVASHNHLIKSAGGGITQFSDNPLLIDEGISDYQVLISYISDGLKGNLGSIYSSTEGRITIQ